MKRWEIYLEIVCEVILMIGCLFIIGFVLPKTLAFLWPLVAGWIIAVLAHPIQRFLQKQLKVSRKLGSAVIVVLVILLVSGVIYLAGSKLVGEGIGFAKDVPTIYQDVEHNIKETWDGIKDRLPQSVADRVSGISGKIAGEITSFLASERGAGYIGSFAKSVTNGLIGIIVMFVSAYLFLADWDKLHKEIQKMEAPEFKKRMKVIKDNILGAVGGYFLAQLKLMFIICVLLLIGFLLLRVHYALILAILIGILDALPFLGVGTALIPWAIYEFIANQTMYGVGLLILYVICLLTRQILQPRIVGQSVGLSSLSTLVLMYVGMKIAGIIGFIIAVVLGIIVKRLYELGMFDGSINRMRSRIMMLKDAD